MPRHFLPLAMLALLAASPLSAAAVVLWPVDPTIPAGKDATALWVENKGQEPVTLQVRALGWAQRAGDDSYADQDEVVASPPIATVPAGSRQLVRIIRRTTATISGEASYRLLIDELPAPFAPGKPDAATAQLAVQMRYSIPLFTYAGEEPGAAPLLRARIELAAGRRYLVIANAGARHARLVHLRGIAGGREVPLVEGLLGYVLAGQTMRWPLPDGFAATGTFAVTVNGADQALAPAA